MTPAQAAARIRKMSSAMRDLSKPLKVSAVAMTAIIQSSFRDQTAPDGTRWGELSPKTIMRRAMRLGGRRKVKRARRGYNVGVDLGLNARAARAISNVKILIDRGLMRGQWYATPSRSGIVIGNPTPYARAHQAGSRDRKLPKRQMAPFDRVAGRWRLQTRGKGGPWMASLVAGVKAHVTGAYRGTT